MNKYELFSSELQGDARYTVTRARLHMVSDSNSKLGKMLSFSKLAGNGYQLQKSGVPIVNVSGSCPCYCEGCYAVESQKLCRENVVRAWAENTLLARDYDAFEDELREYFLSHPNKRGATVEVRINASGEIESIQELRIWAYIAERFETYGYHFYMYTKRFDILEQFTEENGGEPFNLQILLSECDGVRAPEWLRKIYPVFTWYTGQALPAGAEFCPAVLEPEKKGGKGKRREGVTCASCGRCPYGLDTYVYNH